MLETKYKIGSLIVLKEEEIEPPNQSQEEIKSHEKFNCPACNYLVLDTDEYCPDCGLYF